MDKNPFAGRIMRKCGRGYGRKVWNSTDERLRRLSGDALKSIGTRAK